MCNMNCGTCGCCTMLYKVSLGNVSKDKLRYCQLYDMWVEDVVRNYKRGIPM